MTKNLPSAFDAILITGPTASGKSALAAALARKHGGVVINADSMQVYDTLQILTARPSGDDINEVPHSLYGHVAAGTAYSTGAWLRDVASGLFKLKQENKMPVFVGGTGLYFKALLGGLSEMPVIPEEIRRDVRARLARHGPAALHEELAKRDPDGAARLGTQDGQRIARALEVLDATGQPIRQLQSRRGEALVDSARARKLVVLPERAELHKRIDSRFGQMMDLGAVEEVERLLALNLPPDSPIMKAIGVGEIRAMLDGGLSRSEAILRASAATRQYAKRQMTWFRNQMDESWERLSNTSDSCDAGFSHEITGS